MTEKAPHPRSSSTLQSLNENSTAKDKEIEAENVSASARSSLQKDEHAPQEIPSAPAPVAPADDAEKGPTIPATANDLASIPDGGLRAWLQVVGSFFLFFNTWGIMNTFGVYQTVYEIDILSRSSPSSISWIGSVQSFLLLLVGSLTGPVYDSGYVRELLAVGSFFVVFGHMMLSLCTKYWEVILAQAFCIGLGAGCLFVPSIGILSTYFRSKLALSIGIAASGSSLGGVLYPIILNKLIPRIGFAWTVRVIGFITLVTLLIPNLVIKMRIIPTSRRALIDLTAFKSLPFMLFSLGGFFGFVGLLLPFYYVQYYSITKHITDENLAFYLLSILNAASIFGRIVPNFLADMWGPLNVILPCAALTGILTLCLIPVHNVGGIVILILVFGFFSGSFVSLPPTVIVHLTPDRRYVGTRLGMSFAFFSIGILIGAPIAGAILDARGFNAIWIFGGIISLFGASLMAASRVAFKGWSWRVKA